LNWFGFILEFGLVVFLLVGAGIGRASRSYCDRCRKWTRRQLHIFPEGSGGALAESARDRQWAVWQAMPHMSLGGRRRYTAAAVECCLPVGPEVPGIALSECPVYVSLKDVRFGGGLGHLNQWDLALGASRLKNFQLTAADMGPLSKIFPILGPLAVGQVMESSSTARGDSQVTQAHRAFVEIRPMPERFARRIMTRSAVVRGNLIAFVPLVIMMAGVALAGAGIWFSDHESSPFPPVPLQVGFAVAVIAIVSSFVFGIIVLRNASWMGNKYLFNRTRREMELRPDRWVRADDPGAMFVEVVPRANWGKMMFETATDIGFVKVDPRTGAMLFEGDRERYRIPVRALQSAEIATFIVGQGTAGAITYHAVVLRGQTSDGSLWETPILPRVYRLFMPKDFRRVEAERLLEMCRPLVSAD
jgi:hypothetical protein